MKTLNLLGISAACAIGAALLVLFRIAGMQDPTAAYWAQLHKADSGDCPWVACPEPCLPENNCDS